MESMEANGQQRDGSKDSKRSEIWYWMNMTEKKGNAMGTLYNSLIRSTEKGNGLDPSQFTSIKVWYVRHNSGSLKETHRIA